MQHFFSDAVEQVEECVKAEAALAAARSRKETPAKIAFLQEEVFVLKREVEALARAQELVESRKQEQAASKVRALKAAEVERARSMRVLNTQNSLRQSWQQFIGDKFPSRVACFGLTFTFCRITRILLYILSLEFGPRFQKIRVSELVRNGCERAAPCQAILVSLVCCSAKDPYFSSSLKQLVRVPVSQLKDAARNRLTKQVRPILQDLLCATNPQCPIDLNCAAHFG